MDFGLVLFKNKSHGLFNIKPGAMSSINYETAIVEINSLLNHIWNNSVDAAFSDYWTTLKSQQTPQACLMAFIRAVEKTKTIFRRGDGECIYNLYRELFQDYLNSNLSNITINSNNIEL